MGPKTALIICYYFHENTPRAFRAQSLTYLLMDLGYKVEILTGSSIPAQKKDGPYAIHYISRDGLFAKIWGRIFWPDTSLAFYKQGLKWLKNDQKHYDLCVGIAQPMGPLLLATQVRADHIVFDYGDPFTFCPGRKTLAHPWDGFFEKKLLRHCNHILIPTEKAKPAFLQLDQTTTRKLHVLPQFLTPQSIKPTLQTALLSKTDLLFGGRFYDIERPASIVIDYFHQKMQSVPQTRLFIYTEFSKLSQNSKLALEALARKMPQHVFINPIIERTDFIPLAQQAGEVLNIYNRSSVQEPSKQLEYQLLGIPSVNLFGDEKGHLSRSEMIPKSQVSVEEFYNRCKNDFLKILT